MAIDRRTFLAGAAAVSLWSVTKAQAETPLYVSGARTHGIYQAVVFDEAGQSVASLDLPGRGHGVAVDPTGSTSVLFARRPGTFAIAFRPQTGELIATLDGPEDRHFYGHGTFSADGRLLYTSENDFDNARGVIGIWDVRANFARVGEWDSHGIGPHDLSLLGGGGSLAVANGGIETHPDTGRVKLNIPDMEPSLAILSARDGSLLHICRLPRALHKLSIRHLAANRSGTIAAAMQYEGPDDDRPPLVFTWAGGAPRLFEAPGAVQADMRNYCGAVAMDASGSVLAASCPRGNMVTFWDVDSGQLVDHVQMPDGCGIAATSVPNRFLVTSGTGIRAVYDPLAGTREPVSSVPGMQWDNHVAAL